ncbi:Macrolide export protein MacA (plasmid) [Asticcacaulis sp. MM231]|uniref:efflux RND transporter periplasmic adaptor subunit n=1 Tax=Asticcacaulis sp. MM231 TaxID=3157666 RepID=UPI0032D58749
MDTPIEPPKSLPKQVAPAAQEDKVGPKSQRRVWILGSALAAGCVVVAVVVWLLFFNRPNTASLVSATVAFADVEETVLSTGVLVPFVEINVGSRASGLVTSLTVDVGDTVKKGDIIAQIDAANQTNGLTTAQAALLDIQAQKIADQASLDQAQTAYDREARLYAADAGAKADLDLATKAVKSARALLTSVNAQIRQAEVSVRTAQVNLAYTHILAPIDGTVLAVVTKQGQTVNAAQSAPTIVTLGQLDKMTVEAEIAEADVINVTPGMVAYFTILGAPDHRYYGHIRRIQPAPTTFASDVAATTTTSTAVYYYGLFDVDNPDGRLKTTMTANVSIVLAQARHVLTIPSTALGEQAKDGTYAVTVVLKDHKTTLRQVVMGINDGAKAQVISGLAEGETVVIGDGSVLPAASSSASSSATGAPGTDRGDGL